MGYDLDAISDTDLIKDPKLGAIICRLKWKLIPSPIPVGLQAQARYWKVYYNTPSGAGTIDHFIKANLAVIEDEKIEEVKVKEKSIGKIDRLIRWIRKLICRCEG